jgi:hypothetical protein
MFIAMFLKLKYGKCFMRKQLEQFEMLDVQKSLEGNPFI